MWVVKIIFLPVTNLHAFEINKNTVTQNYILLKCYAMLNQDVFLIQFHHKNQRSNPKSPTDNYLLWKYKTIPVLDTGLPPCYWTCRDMEKAFILSSQFGCILFSPLLYLVI